MEIKICAPHPAALFSRDTAELLTRIANAPVVPVGPLDNGITLEEMVDEVEQHRRLLGPERWVIWGMSGGSFVAQLYAHLYPSRVLGLILASSGPYFRTTVEDPECILCPRNHTWCARLDSAGLLSGQYDSGATTWQVVDGVGWVFRREGGAALLISPDPPTDELKRIMPALWAFDSREWLPHVTQPSLVMCGSADPIVPLRHARALAELLPNAHFVPIKDAGHVPITDQRVQVESAIRSFLAKLS